jgi:hypothetical protein
MVDGLLGHMNSRFGGHCLIIAVLGGGPQKVLSLGFSETDRAFGS